MVESEVVFACATCKQCKPKSEFYRKNNSRGVNYYCKECLKKYMKTHWYDSAEYQRRGRERQYQRKYGIGIAEYETLLCAQGGICAVCEQSPAPGKRLVVDHDHNSGAIRGLLCQSCNLALGHFDDNRQRILRALEYLRKHAPV